MSLAPSPTVTVVVCVFNRAAQIRECLDSLRAQDHPCYDILVVDDGSTDGTDRVVESYGRTHSDIRLRLIRKPDNEGVSRARNSALEVARGELIAFLDSDCKAEPNWLTTLTSAFRDPLIAAASGTVVDAPPRNLPERFYVGSSIVGRGPLQRRPLVGNNMCFRRLILTKHRFDPALGYYADDDELAWRLRRAGLAFAFVPGAVVRHDHALHLRSLLHMARLQGEGAARYGYKRGFWVSRDVLVLALAAVSIPFALLRPRIWRWTSLLLAIQGGLMGLNEVLFKGKSLGTALQVIPLAYLYNTVKLAHLVRTHLRILLGREPQIVRSARVAAAERRAGQGGGDDDHPFTA